MEHIREFIYLYNVIEKRITDESFRVGEKNVDTKVVSPLILLSTIIFPLQCSESVLQIL